jgi:hypothetical protein
LAGGNSVVAFSRDMKNAGIGIGLIAAVVGLICQGTGFSSSRKASKR